MPTDGKPKNGIVRQLFSYGGVSAMQTFVEFGVFAVLQLAGLPLCLINGEVSIVELNGLMNSGLFALNMNDLTSALRVNWKQCLPPVLLETAI